MMSTAHAHHPVTAFVLAGGGSLGAVEVGMLQALLEADVWPSFLVGASAGAINAAYFAADPSIDGASRLQGVWCSIRRSDVLPFKLRSVFGLLGRRDHLVDSDGLRALLERHLAYSHIEHASMPVHIVASDMMTGDEVLLSSGPVVDAVLASTAIPGVFPPVELGSRWLVDGGVANNTPISTAFALGASRVIVLPTGYACALNQMPRGAIARAMHATSLLVARQLVHDARRYGDGDDALQLRIVPSLCPVYISPYDYSAAQDLIDQSRDSTRRWLDAGGLERGGIPSQIQDHQHRTKAADAHHSG
jgi:NTE family protein